MYASLRHKGLLPSLDNHFIFKTMQCCDYHKTSSDLFVCLLVFETGFSLCIPGCLELAHS